MIEQIKSEMSDFMEGRTNVFTYQQFRDYLGYLIREVERKEKQIEGLKETLETAIMFLKGSELHVKSEQIKQMRDLDLKGESV